jgi:hypothetical protein
MWSTVVVLARMWSVVIVLINVTQVYIAATTTTTSSTTSVSVVAASIGSLVVGVVAVSFHQLSFPIIDPGGRYPISLLV